MSSEDGGTTTTYEKILNWRETIEDVLAEVELSSEAFSMIRGFLRESKNRLGARGIEEIKAHPFFRGIDWDNIRARPGPIVPHISGPLDTRYESSYIMIDLFIFIFFS